MRILLEHAHEPATDRNAALALQTPENTPFKPFRVFRGPRKIALDTSWRHFPVTTTIVWQEPCPDALRIRESTAAELTEREARMSSLKSQSANC
jgi:hypothetical protein